MINEATKDQCTSLSFLGLQSYQWLCPTQSPEEQNPWAGTWKLNGNCNESQCCCLINDITVTQTGTTANAQGPVAGQCGSIQSPYHHQQQQVLISVLAVNHLLLCAMDYL